MEEEKIKSTITALSLTEKEIDLEVDAAEVEREMEELVGRYASEVKIHGFRPGKAPRDMVKRLFLSEIRKELIDSLAPRALAVGIKSHDENPISLSVIRDISFEEGRPLRFKAVFEVLPEFRLPEYKKIRVKKVIAVVDDKEIEDSLKELQKKSVEYLPVEGRGVRDGDYVVVEIQGRDKKTGRLFPSEKVLILAGHQENEADLNEKLRGLQAGQGTAFSMIYKPDHEDKKLAGKDIEYSLQVLSIKEKKVPEINDDFSKDLGEFDSLEELKRKIKEELLVSKERDAGRRMAEEIIGRIADESDFELPRTMIEQEHTSLVRSILSSYPAQEMKKEFLADLEEKGRRQAEKNVKNYLILRKIAEKEGLEVTEEEIQQEIMAMSGTEDASRARIQEDEDRERLRESLRKRLLINKTVDFLVKNAIIE